MQQSLSLRSSRSAVKAFGLAEEAELNRSELEPDPVIEAYKRHVDRTLIRENLKRSVEERFLALIELQRFARGLREAGRETRQQR